MKVLSIKEPFASLIMNKKKRIETRSWKTNYRGKIYIHASKSKMNKDIENRTELKELIKDISLNQEYIICKANLVDCIYMDEKFIEEIRKDKQEFCCGLYEIGRYAWVLEDVIAITPIKAKGRLNIWNYEENKEE